MKKAIFFDLDGTLIDSAQDLADAVNFMLIKLNKKPYDLQTIRRWIGNGATVLIKRALSGSKTIGDIDEELFEKARKLFFEYYAKNLCVHTQPYPYAKEVLQQLKSKYYLALITNKPYQFVLPILKKLDLEHFHYILGGDSLPEKKPSAAPLLHVCNHFGIRAQEAVMVGDSINDFQAAKNAGIDIVLVDFGYEEDVQKLQPLKCIHTLKELLEVL